MFPVNLLIFIAGMYLAYTKFDQEAVSFSIIGVTLFLMFAIMVALLPTKYQIFNDRIRIILGWILHFDIPFHNIEYATGATWLDTWGLNLNFVFCYSSDNALKIFRKRGVKICICPINGKLFLENLKKSLTEWRKYNPSN
jgi:hypothetical protein